MSDILNFPIPPTRLHGCEPQDDEKKPFDLLGYKYEEELNSPMRLTWQRLQAALWNKLGPPKPLGQAGNYCWDPFFVRAAQGGYVKAGTAEIMAEFKDGYGALAYDALCSLAEMRRAGEGDCGGARVFPGSEARLIEELNGYTKRYRMDIQPPGTQEPIWLEAAAPDESVPPYGQPEGQQKRLETFEDMRVAANKQISSARDLLCLLQQAECSA